MKTLLHAADGKQFSYSYAIVFSIARSIIDRELIGEVAFIRDCIKNGHEVSLEYLVSIADLITTYNELSPLRVFYKTSDF